MEVTFLGHQGWLFEQGRTAVLLDPLAAEMGNGVIRLPVWPNRRMVAAAIPPLSALIISHEHGDHFDIRTLKALPFRGDVFIPDQSAPSLGGMLADLGFTIRRMRPFNTFRIGDLSITPMPTTLNELERDVYGLLVEDQSGGSFLTFVDGVAAPVAEDWLERNCPRRSIDNFTNNAIEPLPYLTDLDWRPDFSGVAAFRPLLSFVDRFEPRFVLISGQGWCYSEGRAWLNSRVFRISNDQLRHAADVLVPGTDWRAPSPGARFRVQGGATTELPDVPWIELLPPADRAFDPDATNEVLRAWSGEEDLGRGDLLACTQFILEEFGPHLCTSSPTVANGLHAAFMEAKSKVQPALLLRLRNGIRWTDFALTFGDRRFKRVRTKGNPFKAYAAGFEMWAGDLRLLINAEEEAHLIYESSVRSWNHRPDLLPAYMAPSLFAWFSPYHRPEAYHAAYRRLHA